jgi:hypothetical protein
MMDVEERLFVVTYKMKGMKCEKIRENYERSNRHTRLFVNY